MGIRYVATFYGTQFPRHPTAPRRVQRKRFSRSLVLLALVLGMCSPQTYAGDDAMPNFVVAGGDRAYHDCGLPEQPVNQSPRIASTTPVTKSLTFKKVGDAKLAMKLWYPPGWQAGDEKLPAIVFFFGGGWHGGDISQFNTIAPHLAHRGMVVVTPEYRTIGKHGVRPNQCLEDAKSAMRYVDKNADDLGIDRDRIAGGGRSAGGHLAAAAALCQGFNAADDDLKVNCKPAALVLFNPVIDNGPGGFAHDFVKAYWNAFSPLHNISTNPPPTLFFTGDKDQYTPIETAEKYKAEMEKHGGRCDLVIYKDGVHGSPFHPDNHGRTVEEMDRFLVSLGYLKANSN